MPSRTARDAAIWSSILLPDRAPSSLPAERTGRKARALEIDPRYCDVAIRRWQNYTGKSARLCPLGETFEEVADQRHALDAA